MVILSPRARMSFKRGKLMGLRVGMSDAGGNVP
jgi:hypothetical protein